MRGERGETYDYEKRRCHTRTNGSGGTSRRTTRPAACRDAGACGRSLWRLGAVALLVAVAFSQVGPLQIIPLAQGSDTEHNVILHMKGATDVLQADLIFPNGTTTGWHIHPGPVVVVIKSGALTEIHSNGCMTVHNAGSAFFEDPDEVHNVINQSGVVTEVLATFLSPAGTPPLIPVPDPGNVCRK